MPTLKEEILINLYGGLYYLMSPYELCWGNQQYHVNSFYKAVARLEKQGLLKKDWKEKNMYLKLTEKGKKIVREHRKSVRRLRRYWDGKWRVVIFDIPEKRGPVRGYLRDYLKSLGFGMVQRSIWITPYDFGRMVDHFSKKMKLTDYVYQITVTGFRGLNDLDLVRIFWPLKTINSRYRELVKTYSVRLNQFQRKKVARTQSNSEFGRSLLDSLVWDYQTIAARDPHLPDQLLPSGWSQKEALQLIQRVRNIFHLNLN